MVISEHDIQNKLEYDKKIFPVNVSVLYFLGSRGYWEREVTQRSFIYVSTAIYFPIWMRLKMSLLRCPEFSPSFLGWVGTLSTPLSTMRPINSHRFLSTFTSPLRQGTSYRTPISSQFLLKSRYVSTINPLSSAQNTPVASKTSATPAPVPTQDAEITTLETQLMNAIKVSVSTISTTPSLQTFLTMSTAYRADNARSIHASMFNRSSIWILHNSRPNDLHNPIRHHRRLYHFTRNLASLWRTDRNVVVCRSQCPRRSCIRTRSATG
jgi:hypothetical protein